LSVLEYPVIRYDSHGTVIANVYDVSHQSDNGTDNEDDEEAAAARKARKEAAGEGEISEYRKTQLEKEAKEKQLLEVQDADYYNVAEQADALVALTSQFHDGDDADLMPMGSDIDAEADNQMPDQ
jgi:hypothetical protein